MNEINIYIPADGPRAKEGAALARELLVARLDGVPAVPFMVLEKIVRAVVDDPISSAELLVSVLLSLSFIAETAAYAPRGDEQGPPDREVATENLRRLVAHLEAKGATF